MEASHLHPFDIKSSVVMNGKQNLTIFLRYGEGFKRMKSISFSPDPINRISDELAAFFREAAEDCRNMLVEDFYNRLK
jgi:hypothetical protein